APLSVLAQDAAAGEEQLPSSGQTISIYTGVKSVNDLLIGESSVSALFLRGAFALGGELGVNRLFLSSVDAAQAADTEINLSVYGLWRHRYGRLEVGLGGNLRADANLFQGWMNESFHPWRGATLNLGVHLNELAYDTSWMRIYGARHRAT